MIDASGAPRHKTQEANEGFVGELAGRFAAAGMTGKLADESA